jgi:hypothetical protein
MGGTETVHSNGLEVLLRAFCLTADGFFIRVGALSAGVFSQRRKNE